MVERFVKQETQQAPVGASGQFRCLVGPLGEDVVPYVRNRVEDVGATQIPDTALQAAVNNVARDVSRFYPIKMLVGDIYNQTSPLVTVSGQQRYKLNSENGFTLPVVRVTDVLYRASGGFTAASEASYLMMLPFSPLTAFLLGSDLLESPTLRVIRDEYLNELGRYGVGKAGVVLDETGTMCVDLYPVPGTSGLPVFVRYDSVHVAQPIQGDPGGSVEVPTLPDVAARYFGQLLLAEIVEQIALRVGQAADSRAGQVEIRTDPATMNSYATRLRNDIYLEMGVSSGVAEVTY